MATQPNSFISVIDESETVNFNEWDKVKKQLEGEYKQLCNDERETGRSITSLVDTQGQLQDVQRKLKALSESGLSDLQGKVAYSNTELSKAKSSKKGIDDLIHQLEALCSDFAVISVEEPESDLGKWQLGINEIQKSLTDAILCLTENSKQQILNVQGYYQRLNRHVEENTLALTSKIEELHVASIDPEEISTLMEKESCLQETLKNEPEMQESLTRIQQNKQKA